MSSICKFDVKIICITLLINFETYIKYIVEIILRSIVLSCFETLVFKENKSKLK
jgi:hypothetical protein